jgi:predicted Zn-dependent protease
MKINKLILIASLIFMISGCKTSPFTGKQTLNFVSNDELFPMSFQQYNEFLSQNNVVTGTAESRMVKQVGKNIAVAAERYMTALGYPGYLKDYKWEYNLVKDDAANAFAMPGGKIVVYTGILPITEDEAGLAMVMGHELAHALANHGAQRMSAAQVQQGVGVAGGLALGDSKSGQLFNQYYGTASNVGVMLPFSRKHESEADEIGTIIAAIAGYDPTEAAELWKRMAAKSGGQQPMEIMSTHPSSASRIEALTALVPRAKEEAAKFGVTKFKS